MMDLTALSDVQETVIVFSKGYSQQARGVYTEYSRMYPAKQLTLLTVDDVICAAKLDSYESYIVVGVSCPLHPFKRAVFYRHRTLDPEVVSSRPALLDSTYLLPCESMRVCAEMKYSLAELASCLSSHNGDPAYAPLQVISAEPRILDYFARHFEDVQYPLAPDYAPPSRIKFLLSESAKEVHVHNKKMFGVVYTSREFESQAEDVCRILKRHARAYRIFLKDVSYERLISVEHIDCIVLIDCPLFKCDLRLHVPIVSAAAVFSAVALENNEEEAGATNELALTGYVGELMKAKEFQGVPYASQDQDMQIHEGRSGIACQYSTEPGHS